MKCFIIFILILSCQKPVTTKELQSHSKIKLKEISRLIINYFEKNKTTTFPDKLETMNFFSTELFTHPLTKKEYTFKEIVERKGDYLLNFKPGDSFDITSERILVFEKKNIWGNKIYFAAVSEGRVIEKNDDSTTKSD